jgi:hypothetical protein
MVDYHPISGRLIRFGLFLELRRFRMKGLFVVCPRLTYKKIAADVQT